MNLRDIIREMLKHQLSEASPEAQGLVGPRGKPPRSWGGRRVYDKASKEAFDVVGFLPSDPDEKVENVILQSREKKGKKLKVSYDDFLSKYLRHTGDPVKTPGGMMSPHTKSWAGEEIRKLGGERGEFSGSRLGAGPMRGPGAVDVDPETGEWKRLPGLQMLEPDPTSQSPGTVKSTEEIALDKVEMQQADPGLFKKMASPYLASYKDALAQSILKAQKAMKDYRNDILTSGELDDDEVEWLKSKPAAEVFAAIWELPNFHNHILPELGIPSQHASTISSIVGKTAGLSVKQLKGDDRTDAAVIADPGFLVWLDKADDGRFWNSMRKELESRSLYRGQF